MRDDRNRNEIHSETFEQDSLYWRKFVQEASGYVRFYRTGEGKTRTRSLSVDQDAVSAFLVQRGRTRLELFGSVFSLYLSRIHRLGGCLLRTSVPAGWRTMIRVDVDSRSRFSDLTGIFRSALAEAAAHTRMDIDGYLREKATWYAVYDVPDGNEDDAVLALLSGPGRLSLRYHPDVFSETYMDHMAKNLESVLAAVLRDPDQVPGEMELLSGEERALLTACSAGKTVRVDEDRTLSASFREYAKAHPDAIAVDDGVRRVKIGRASCRERVSVVV